LRAARKSHRGRLYRTSRAQQHRLLSGWVAGLAPLLFPEAEAFCLDFHATPYRVLARKYRPTTFDDLIGQEAMVRTLRNAFAVGRVAHAFMLTGVRGVGKTTTARIIARALNCTGPDAFSVAGETLILALLLEIAMGVW